MAERQTVLIVDDEPRNRAALADVLSAQGYTISQASDGVEALVAIRAMEPDAILLDISMPRMDGLGVLRALRKDDTLRHIPVVVITGHDDSRKRLEALELGADDFLMKPPHLPELLARVRTLLRVKAYNDHMRDHQKELEAEVNQRTSEIQRTVEELLDAHRKLRAASLDTIYRLTRAAEYRDDDTGNHVRRISNYTAAISRRMGLDAEVVDSILYASPMHDVGKIGIPDRILLKAGKLADDEFALMKQHTTIGAGILESSTNDILLLARSIALTHHEKWDGSGYPVGLQGEDIPLSGRIVAVADVFDALTSRRPYKEPWPLDKSIDIIRQGRSKHFDPSAVDAFLDIRDEIGSIMQTHNDAHAAG